MNEKVLVIPADKYNSKLTLGSLKDIISAEGRFLDRPTAEVDQNFLQIIPYIIVRRGTSVFCYERLKKGTEQRLHSKFSIGIGGHINDEDVVDDLGMWPAVEAGAYRELHDELTITNPGDGSEGIVVIDFVPLIIYDPSNDVGKVHLGLVGTVDVLDHDIMIGEPDKIKGSFIDILKLKSKMPSMETWSQIAMQNENIWWT